MASTKNLTYTNRDFTGIRQSLLNYAQQYYPDIYGDLNDASIGTSLIELNAAVGDLLSYNTDQSFNETQLDYVQQKRNILGIAKTLGLNVPGKKPSITLVDFSVSVPPFGDTYDATYLPLLKQGSQVIGAGKVFETLNDIDFSNGYSSIGTPNRTIIPNIDTNNNVKSYTITKQEIVVNGTTQIFQKTILATDYKPFIEIILPDDDVISVEQIINLNGTNFSTNPTLSQFLSNKSRFYEVDSLVDDKIFIEDTSTVTDRSDVLPGKYISVSKKFIKEYTDSGYCKITFGGGMPNQDVFNNFIGALNLNLPYFTNYLNNNALGEIPQANSTIFIRYRVGGGAASNVGANTITSLGNIDISVNGVRQDINQAVQTSLIVNNPIPALGGNDEPSIEQIRRLISYNYSAQNRCVTSRDYITQIQKMPGQFGAPFRLAAEEVENKIVISILALNQNGKLTNQSTNILKNNIAEYISKYRMMNDYVEITDGRIINLAFTVSILMDKTFNQSTVAAGVISTVADFLDITKHDMNENIYISQLIENVNNVPGVLNVINLQIFGKTGGDYGVNEINQPYIDASTKEIELIDYTLYGEADTQFQILNESQDVNVLIKTN